MHARAKTPPPVAPPITAPLVLCFVGLALAVGVAGAEEVDVADVESDVVDTEVVEDADAAAELAVVVATVAGTVKVDPPATTTVWTPAGLRSASGHPALQGSLSQQPWKVGNEFAQMYQRPP